uniref:(California timema) hypothetical protein n=1 Tax=Timema californicum TaxID=61474 RepID=A0A7R9J5H8_TIMCA|nr:unnamed protein product [Timema californicum]
MCQQHGLDEVGRWGWRKGDVCGIGGVQALWNVEYFYSQELDIIYLTGKKKQSSVTPEIYVPVSATADITPEWIELVQNILCKDKETKGVTLAIKEQDSSIVYYRITQALVPPDSPETAKRMKIREDRHRCLEGELRRRRQELFNQAQESKGYSKNRTHPDQEKSLFKFAINTRTFKTSYRNGWYRPFVAEDMATSSVLITLAQLSIEGAWRRAQLDVHLGEGVGETLPHGQHRATKPSSVERRFCGEVHLGFIVEESERVNWGWLVRCDPTALMVSSRILYFFQAAQRIYTMRTPRDGVKRRGKDPFYSGTLTRVGQHRSRRFQLIVVRCPARSSCLRSRPASSLDVVVFSGASDSTEELVKSPPPLSLDSSLHPLLLPNPPITSLLSSQSPTPRLDLHNFQSPSYTLTSFQPYNFLHPSWAKSSLARS